jgi:hypothetical protein
MDDPRLRLLNGPGRGLNRNIEFLLGRAQGDFIFLADQDDVWLPSKVAVMLGALRQGTDVVMSDCLVVDRYLQQLQPSYFALVKSRPGLVRNILKNSYLGCCMAMRRELLPFVLPFPKPPPAHDWWIGLTAEIYGTVRFIETPLLMYRRHGSNASSASGQSSASVSDRVFRRIQLVHCLLARCWSLRER